MLCHADVADRVVEELHRCGLVEITDIKKEKKEVLEELEPASAAGDYSKCLSYEIRLRRLLDILERYGPETSGIRAMLHPEPVEPLRIEEEELEKIESRAEAILAEIEEDVFESEARLKDLDERKKSINEKIQTLREIKVLNSDLDMFGEGVFTVILPGKTRALNEVKSVLADTSGAIISRELGKGKEKYHVAALILLKEEYERVSTPLKKYFTSYDLPEFTGNPIDAIRKLNKEIEDADKEKAYLIVHFTKVFKEKRKELLALEEEFGIQGERRGIFERFAKSEFTYLIEGWCLERETEKLEKVFNEASEGSGAFFWKRTGGNPDNPPVHLDQPNWLKPFRVFTEIFAWPRYDEIDPTCFAGIGFALFFGIMLGDAGYGLIILILSLAGFLALRKSSEMIKQWTTLGIWIGGFTTAAGFAFGGFFGDLLPSYFPDCFPTGELYSLKLASFELPLNPLNRPMDLLAIALIIGLVHLNLSLCIAVYEDIFRRNRKKILFGEVPWFLLQFGGIFLICSYLLHIQWFADRLVPPLQYFVFASLVLGILLLLLGKGPLGIFDITGFIGDVLSYARLLALGLATGGIALAINLLAKIFSELIGAGIVSIILLMVILAIGHVFNMVIQALGSAVHSLRLQYVEFFKRFYEGGGKEFSPFMAMRIYTSIDEKEAIS
jgi:V/A-type H+-transporting ATPase subunit I